MGGVVYLSLHSMFTETTHTPTYMRSWISGFEKWISDGWLNNSWHFCADEMLDDSPSPPQLLPTPPRPTNPHPKSTFPLAPEERNFSGQAKWNSVCVIISLPRLFSMLLTLSLPLYLATPLFQGLQWHQPIAVISLLKQLLWNVNHNFNLYCISILINSLGLPLHSRCFLDIVTEEMTFWLIKFVSAAELSKL